MLAKVGEVRFGWHADRVMPHQLATRIDRHSLSGPIRRSRTIQRALQVLRAVNKFRIATVNDIFSRTETPKPTIVRVLETLIVDNMAPATISAAAIARHLQGGGAMVRLTAASR